MRLAAADERLGAGEQFAQVEGLGEVVVGTGVEQFDDLRAFVPGSQDQDRSHVFAAAHLTHDTEAVETGQHEVEQKEVVVAVFGERDAIKAIFGAVDREAATLAQGLGDVIGEANLIFDDKHSHK